MEFDVCADVRVKAPNPYTDGMVLYDRLDYFPHGFTKDELDTAYYGLIREHTDYDMMMEAAPFEDVDEYYNPGTEEVDPAFVMEAVVVKKFSRLEGVIRRGIVKAMNKYMTATDPTTGTPITALDPVVGKPRKSGLFAYVTVQIPFSDGQVVSIVFHAPEGDQKKISPDDTVVAFRWVLNKRDITSVVAPEDGKEISLETIAKRVGQLVEKNTKRFASTQKEVQAEKRELEETNTQIKETQNRVDRLIIDVAEGTKQIESLDVQIGTTSAALEKQKTINAELRAKLEALRKAQAPTPTPTPTGASTMGGTSARYLDFKNRNWNYAGDKKTWVKDNGDGTITVKRAAKGTISEPYLEELKTFCTQYGYDFSQLKSGESITLVKTPAGTGTGAGTTDGGETGTGTNTAGTDTDQDAEQVFASEHPGVSGNTLSLLADVQTYFTKKALPFTWEKGINVVMNASRPLLGDESKEDEYIHGRYFVKVNLNSDSSYRHIEYNKNMHAYVAIQVSEELSEKIGLAFLKGNIKKEVIKALNSDDPKKQEFAKSYLGQRILDKTLNYKDAIALIKKAEEEGVSFAGSTPDQGNTPPDSKPEYKMYAGLVNAEKDFLAALSKDKDMKNAIKDGDETKAMSRLSTMLSFMESGHFGTRMGDNFAENRYGFRDGLTKTATDWVKAELDKAANISTLDPGQDTQQAPAFVQDLNDILAGKYDNDSRRIIDMLEKALDEAEKPGNEQYQDLVDKASNYYTEILSREAN